MRNLTCAPLGVCAASRRTPFPQAPKTGLSALPERPPTDHSPSPATTVVTGTVAMSATASATSPRPSTMPSQP